MNSEKLYAEPVAGTGVSILLKVAKKAIFETENNKAAGTIGIAGEILQTSSF